MILVRRSVAILTVLRPYPYRTDGDREPYTGRTGCVVVRGASHDDPADSLGLTRRTLYDHRGAAAGHHFVGFRCATSEDLGEVAPGGPLFRYTYADFADRTMRLAAAAGVAARGMSWGKMKAE